MPDFVFYFGLGWHHIISLDALDHQLFILALASVYTFKNIKQVLILVTAFTIGHSLTLALSVLDIIRFSSKWVEFLIPCTIFITALNNIIQIDKKGASAKINCCGVRVDERAGQYVAISRLLYPEHVMWRK